jgi:hypothetical protein
MMSVVEQNGQVFLTLPGLGAHRAIAMRLPAALRHAL